MMAEGDFPDVEAGVRAYLRADVDVSAAVNARVFFGVPKNNPTFPLVTLARVGGGQDASEVPVDLAVVNINCWGNSTKDDAAIVMNAVRRALNKLRRRTLVSGVALHGAQVDTVIWSPDPEDARPRYIVTARVTASAA